MEKAKKLLSVQNFIILFLLIAIIVISVITINNKAKCKVENESVNITYKKPDDVKTLCQRDYFFNDSDSYMFSICDGKLYVSKNDEEYKELSLDNVSYMHKFMDLEETSFYFLTMQGEVYYLSSDNVINESYELITLDYKNIVTLEEFYVGYTKEDAYQRYLYAIDNDDNMITIK